MTTAITEILDGIRDGRYRMINSRVDPLQRLRLSAEMPKGEWVPLKKYHPNTVRAAQRRLTYQFNADTMTGHFILK